jgi:hypothetical protein
MTEWRVETPSLKKILHHTSTLSRTDKKGYWRQKWTSLAASHNIGCVGENNEIPVLKRPIHSQLNWAILLCDVISDGKTELTAKYWQAIAQASEMSFPVVFHTENCAVHSGNPTVSSVYLPTPWWYHLKSHPFLAIHSADEHRIEYSFSNTTSYSTFYAFFSSFRITLWPMCLVNTKRQSCFYPPYLHVQEDTQNWQKKLTDLMGNLCCAREHSVQFFVQFCYTVKLQSLT